MSLVRASALFKIEPAKTVNKQRVSLRPNEHRYEEEGEEPYIKYTCQICEQLAREVRGYKFDEGNFTLMSFPEGTPNCPCCGIRLNWNYKHYESERGN